MTPAPSHVLDKDFAINSLLNRQGQPIAVMVGDKSQQARVTRLEDTPGG
jgi:hypothetical protein